MQAVFYISGVIAILATVLMVTRLNAVHALLYLIVSLLAVAVVFYVLGAAFAAALEVVIYAGAIMVLFIFVVMMLNIGERATRIEKEWLTPGAWVGPGILALCLLAELFYILSRAGGGYYRVVAVEPEQVGVALYGPYLMGVELASMLLLAGLVGAYHLGWRKPRKEKEDRWN